MSVRAKAHLIFGYQVSNIPSFELDDDMFEKYEDPTATKPGIIYGYEGPEYFGCLIAECDEDESATLVTDGTRLDIDISTFWNMREEFKKIIGENPGNSCLYLACLNH